MYLQFRFCFWAFLTFGLLLLVAGLLVFVTEKVLSKPGIPPPGIIVFLALFIFTFIWLVFGELRTNVIKVQIDSGQITVSNYFGLDTKKKYNLSQFDGFETSLLPSNYDWYEYLYLIENGKKAIKISQFYHSNYSELKNALSDRIQYLGHKNFSWFREIKEIFF